MLSSAAFIEQNCADKSLFAGKIQTLPAPDASLSTFSSYKRSEPGEFKQPSNALDWRTTLLTAKDKPHATHRHSR
jgi:hypothetical protein